MPVSEGGKVSWPALFKTLLIGATVKYCSLSSRYAIDGEKSRRESGDLKHAS